MQMDGMDAKKEHILTNVKNKSITFMYRREQLGQNYQAKRSNNSSFIRRNRSLHFASDA